MDALIISFIVPNGYQKNKKAILKNFAVITGKHLCCSLFLLKRDTPAQVFSFEYCEIFKNTYFEEHLRTAASGV